MIFIFGSARSGSTWLGKIFDSHPDLLYLHEPDIPDRGSDLLPHWFEREPTAREIENARIYLIRLAAARNIRAIGTIPFFKKSYRGGPAEAARRSLIFGAKLIERVGLAGSIEIPDLARRGTSPQIVIKSVSALGRTEALLAADRSLLPILLIRHPCGFVSSMLRGKTAGRMPKAGGLGRLARTRSAMRLGLDVEVLDNANEVTMLAWEWLLSNAEAYQTIKRANGIVLIYEELTRDPVTSVKRLFAGLSLGWPGATAGFLAHSQETDGDYYSVFRDSRKASGRWRDELDTHAIETVRTIAVRDPIGSQFFSEG